MTAPAFPLVPVLLMLPLFGSQVMMADTEEACRKLDASFRFQDKLFLIAGEDFYQIDDEQHETESGRLADLYGSSLGPLDAATVWAGDDTLYFFSGNQYYYYSTWFDDTYGPYPNSRWAPFFVGGIDAAARVGWQRNYFFKGCEYVTYEEGVGYSVSRPVHELQLPCDLDAAWGDEERGALIAVKGSESWAVTLRADGRANARGPVELTSEVTLTSTSLCGSEDKGSAWASRMRLELEFESEHGCVIVDSALDYEGTVYLFNNDSYVRLNENWEEDKLAENVEWGGLTSGIDAAVYTEKSSKVYFFQGDQYFAYYGLAFGPFSSSSDWAAFFSAGVDAAAARHGKVYAFQGCRVAQYDVEEEKMADVRDSEGDLGLPCDVNAAFFGRDDALYVVKGDMVWIWADDEEVSGPGPLKELVTLKSWTLCP